MTDQTQQLHASEPALSPLKRAFLALENAERRIVALETAAREPIAVIGIGCRVPGADGPDAFWRLLRDGVDAIAAIPADRFDIDMYFNPDPEAPGGIVTRHGGFLPEVDQFDCGFFGIAPREARGIDPQQRLLLEVAWEALEHAGQAPLRLEGSKTGVYFGQCASDYAYLQILTGDPGLLDAHFGSGIAHSVASGRLSYLLGLQGPSLSIDTACSSSLVAVHVACQALRSGDCRMALAGGVNLLLGPELFVAFSRSRMLAPDGRCKTFSAAADGFSRSEGCGVVVLKKLADAKADGDRILAVIRGTAVNQDGPSSALTAPNGPAQEDVIRAALAQAGLAPKAVGYVEAHGTGTQLGDPLEIQALDGVFHADRDPAKPLLVGSAKTNVGHLEAAAGVTGLIKLILAARNKQIPPHLHMNAPNPHIDWAAMPLAVPAGLTAWEPIDGRRIGGVSAFGFSGTNAHVIVEEWPTEESSEFASPTAPTAHLFALSARDATALAVHARRFAAVVSDSDERDLPDLCHTANSGRSHFAERATVVARTIGELSNRLESLARGVDAPGLRKARLTQSDPPRVAFVFTGQGSQYVGMARGLHVRCPAFRDAFDRCDALLAPIVGRPLHEFVLAGDTRADIDNTRYAQPALFAVEYALAETWRSFGVAPGIVAGHSVGEIVAAAVAGVFSLEDACRLVARRGALMGDLTDSGGMAAIAASEPEVAATIAAHGGDVAIAAVNAPSQIVVSGATAAVDAVCAAFVEKGVRTQRLSVSHAFHSPLMDPVLGPFEREMQAIAFAPPRIPLVSNLTGRIARPGEVTQARYWRRHVREAVRFGDCVRTIGQQKPGCIVEIGPRRTLLALFGESGDGGPALVSSLQKGRDDWGEILNGASALFLAGVDINWKGVECGERRRIVDLPTYPFQRQRHWFAAKPRSTEKVAADPAHHPLLGRPVPSPLPQKQFESRLSSSAPSYIDDHRISGTALLPGAAGVEMALAAAAAVFGPGSIEVERIALREAMIFTDSARVVQTLVDPIVDGGARFQIHSRLEHSQEWTLHFEGRLLSATSGLTSDGSPFAKVEARCRDRVSVDDLYSRLRRKGVEFGLQFHVVRELFRGEAEAWSSIALAEGPARDRRYHLHPLLLDGCLQTVTAALPPDADPEALYLPIAVGRLRVYAAGSTSGRAHARLEPMSRPGASIIGASVNLYGEGDDLIATVEGLEFQRVRKNAFLRQARGGPNDGFYERVWEPASHLAPTDRRPLSWVVLEDRGGVGRRLAEMLEKRGDRCLLRPTDSVADLDVTEARTAWRKWRDACGGAIHGVIDLRWLDCAADETGSRWESELRSPVSGSLALIDAAILQSAGQPVRLWVVTRGAQPAGDVRSPLSALASAAWGLTWSAALEHRELRAICVDLDQASNPDELDRLITELDQDGCEDKVALRGDQRWVARLRRRDPPAAAGIQATPEPYRLQMTGQGVVDGFVLAPAERRAPGPGEVEIRVRATGLNFRDVLNALGLYPDGAGPLGGECAGDVARVGEGVRDLRVGDRVVAMAAGCFASHVITKRELVALTPAGFADDEAAAHPIAYLTAAYALEEAARLTRGDRVLIHAAAGGVGLAAVNLALRAGAEVFASAGSEVKRARLRALGVHHVLDSRDDSFDADIARLTGGRGVDVVLNSLSGSFIDASFRATARRGRFIEIGKRGLWTAEQVARLGREIDYRIIDLGEASEREPKTIARILSRLMRDLAEGMLPALPVTTFALDDAAAAFRHMAKARHIGKIVVSHRRFYPPPLVRPDGQYLVTGGLSGLGLAVAKWLVTRGAKHVALVGRRGADSPDASAAVRALADAGAVVSVGAVDVGDEPSLDAFLAERRSVGLPLRGVFHAAGVIDDGAFRSQNWARFETVLRPKVGGAQNLDRLTRADPLDWFVMFSSAASLLGSPGQANYAAANSVLDAIAHQRRRVGRPGLSIDWGPWAEVGMAAAPAVVQRMEATGLRPLPVEEALDALEAAMRADVAQVGVFETDWAQFLAGRDPDAAPSRYFSALARPRSEAPAPGPALAPFRTKLADAPSGRRPALVRNLVRETAIRVLGLSESDGPSDSAPLSEAGLDSLLAIELRNSLAKSLQMTLSATLLFEHPTIEALSAFLWDELRGAKTSAGTKEIAGRPASERSAEPSRGSDLLAEIAGLSDAEVESFLGAARPLARA